MKKAFDQNVSRSRPRLRLGALMTAVEEAQQEAAEELAPPAAPVARAQPPAAAEPPVRAEPPPEVEGESLTRAVKARAEQARAPRPTAAEALQAAIHTPPAIAREAEAIVARATAAVLGEGFEAPRVEREEARVERGDSRVEREDSRVEREEARVERGDSRVERGDSRVERGDSRVDRGDSRVERGDSRVDRGDSRVERGDSRVEREEARVERGDSPVARETSPVVAAHHVAPAEVIEVQTPPSPHDHEDPPEVRRERLRERLKAVRENPRPEPLPPTVAEAGVLAVERIATLQTELHKVKALNLALTQDLEGARRQAEKATEEARLRMEESRRLSQEMEGRVKLLADLERELAALEGERDEALLALQESRQGLFAADEEKAKFQEEIAQRDEALAESLAEEERLCAELEMAREQSDGLRRSVSALTSERDTLARQVSELTRERAELLEARKALEAVHRALSQAVAR